MKLKEILEKLDKSDKNEDYICMEKLSQECGIQELYFYDGPELKCYFIGKHFCTDTFVGWRAYYLNDELVCISSQPHRKSHEVYYWVSNETKSKVLLFLTSLIVKESDEVPENFIDLDEEFGDGFKLEYSSEVLADAVIYKDEKVKVVEKFRNSDKWHTIKINYNNEDIVVNMKEITIPYNIN